MFKTLSERAAWYRRRLSAMSGPEIGHRIVEQARRSASRRRGPGLPEHLRPGPGGLPVLPGLADGINPLADRPDLRARLSAVADRAASGRISLLGVTWPVADARTRWHIDPVTGRSWPADRYCFAIAYRHAPEMGDVKYAWELNRLPHVQAMALLAALDRDDALAHRCVAEIDGWIEANPPFQGVNWASGIELALRTISLMVAISLIGQGAFQPDQIMRLRSCLAAHGYWLMRFPSRFSSANNHLIAEATGLYLLGRLAPDLPGAAQWASYGRRTLIEEALRQIHPDGVGAEQSPTYTAFTLEFLLLAATVGARSGEPFPSAFWERIVAAGNYLNWITDAGGHQPRIGDDDEGRVLHSGGEASYVCGVLEAIAAAAGRPDLAPPRTEPHLRQALFGRAAPRRAAPSGVNSFRDGGYTVMRSGAAAGECLLMVDHGPLGYLSIAAHGHADALAVWLHLGGRPVLVDAGTYLYHAGAVERDHFRGTAAHNTLTIAGADSSRIAGPFNWSEKAESRLVDISDDPSCWAVEVEHDGFVRRFGLTHRRRVARDAAGTFTIEDRLVGDGAPQPVEIGFLVHPDLTVAGEGARWTVADGERPLLKIEHDGPLSGVLTCGQQDPRRGWYSGAFGTKEPTSRLGFVGTVAADVICAFKLMVIQNSSEPVRQWPASKTHSDRPAPAASSRAGQGETMPRQAVE